MADSPASNDPEIRGVFDEFKTHTGMAVPHSDYPDVRTRARRRQASLWAIATVAVVALVVPVAIYVGTGRGSSSRTGSPLADTSAPFPGAPLPGAPTTTARTMTAASPRTVVAPKATVNDPPTDMPTPSPSPSAPPTSNPAAPSIRDTDWHNVTLQIPANQTGCAAGTAEFHHALADVGASRYFLGGGVNPTFEIGYGDADADGIEDALLVVSCVTPAERKNPPSLVLLIGAGPPHVMAMAFSSGPRAGDDEGRSLVSDPAIAADGTITYLVRTYEGTGQCQYHQRFTGTGITGECDP